MTEQEKYNVDLIIFNLQNSIKYYQSQLEAEKQSYISLQCVNSDLQREIKRLKIEIKRRDNKLTRVYEEIKRKDDDLK